MANIPLWEPNTDIGSNIKWTYQNFDKSRYIIGNIQYLYQIKAFQGMLGFTATKPYIDITYLDTERTLNKMSYNIIANSEIRVAKNTMFFIDFLYRSSGVSNLFEFKKSYYLDLGLSQYFFNKKLYINIGIEDIFKTVQDNDWILKYANAMTTMDSDADTRRISIKIRYNIGKTKVNVSKKSANEGSINRL